jgi:hypothetical protein
MNKEASFKDVKVGFSQFSPINGPSKEPSKGIKNV